MTKRSAGLLIYRMRAERPEVLLVHPGGPFWARKDDGAWSIPKGLIEPGEDELSAGRREAMEELGVAVDGRFERLGEYRQAGGKVVVVWTVEAELDVSLVASNSFRMEWPPRSGVMRDFPEVDRAEWFDIETSRLKMLRGQQPMLGDLLASLGGK